MDFISIALVTSLESSVNFLNNKYLFIDRPCLMIYLDIPPYLEAGTLSVFCIWHQMLLVILRMTKTMITYYFESI